MTDYSMSVMEGLGVVAGTKVLLLWAGDSMSSNMQELATTISDQVRAGPDGRIQLEHIERLSLSSHPNSSFDMVISGLVNPLQVQHTIAELGELCRVLKPHGKLVLQEFVVSPGQTENGFKTREKLMSELKLSGFVNITEPQEVSLSDDEKVGLNKFKGTSSTRGLCRFAALKPAYEVGSSTQLKLALKPKPRTQLDESVAKVWSLKSSDLLDDDLDLVNEDDLLDEDDLKKPDPVSLKVDCGSNATKKKACKNCTCGLSEELDTTQKVNTIKTSACGNCNLGDAFRCTSCPYLGMPAFKSGEKIALSSRQLKADA